VKRLPEPYDVTDPNEEYASTLLQHTGPLEPSAMRKRRVWMALERSAMKRSRIRVSGPAIAALVLLGATAASATMPRLWRRLQATPAASEIAAMDSVEAPRAHRRSMKTPAAPLVPTAAVEAPGTALIAPDPVAADPIVPSAPLAHAANPSSGAKKAAPSVKARAAAEAVDPPAGAALMVEAMRERRAGNLAHARELSAEYRLKYPAGALQEEAFALSIEAAAALGDDEARRIAATYLQRYPRGRFRAQAERALGASR
jgi:hypothetical protein